MLEIRPSCEHCCKELPNTSTEAMICSFECTYCTECAKNIFKNVCPNCGGNFEMRPIRPSKQLQKYPASTIIKHKPINLANFAKLLKQFKDITPNQR